MPLLRNLVFGLVQFLPIYRPHGTLIYPKSVRTRRRRKIAKTYEVLKPHRSSNSEEYVSEDKTLAGAFGLLL